MSDGDTDPRPFRRFPWAQLAFCVACLAMTAWTWMRYSYAWQTTPTVLTEADAGWVGRYVALGGTVTPGEPDAMADFVQSNDGHITIIVRSKPSVLVAGEGVVNGRVVDLSYSHRLGRPPAIRMVGVNPSVSRLTGESVAGLVVGAMGCAIFGLYLRRWLHERKSAEPADG